MSDEIVLGMRFTVDGKEAVGQIRVTRAEFAALREETKKSAQADDQGRREAERYVAGLIKKANTLGMTKGELERYEIAQLNLTESEKKAAIELQRSTERYEKLQGVAQGVGRAVAGMASAAVAGAAALYGVVKQQSIEKLMEAEQASLSVTAALKATGYAAGVTQEQIDDMADSLAASTKFDDESVREAAATLLTFRDIQGDVFREALKLSADVAAKMRTDLPSAAQTLARALQDPENAQRLMAVTGGRLNEVQVETIKKLLEQGKVVEAQRVVLDRLNATLQNTAQLMNSGYSKAWNDSKKATDELLESLGRTDIIGGKSKRMMEGITTIMVDLKEQVDGTSNRFSGFFGEMSKASEIIMPAFSKAMGLVQRSMEKPTNQRSGKIFTANESEEEAKAREGAARQREEQQQEKIALADKKAREEKAKLAKQYLETKKAADEWLKSLQRQSEAVGASTEQKMMLEARDKAMTLATNEERSAFLASATALAHKAQVEEDAAKVKKEYEDALKKSIDTQSKELDQIAQQIDQQKKKNAELEESGQALLEYQATQLEAIATGYEFADGADAQTQALRRKAAMLRELGKLQVKGDELEKAKQTAKDYTREIEREMERRQDFISDILSDAIAQGGIKGADLLKRIINSLVLKPGVDFASQGISNALWGAAGSAGGGGGGGGSMLGNGLINAGANYLGTAVFGSTAAYSAAGFTGTQAAMLAAQTGEFGFAGLAATTSAGAGAAGAGVGTELMAGAMSMGPIGWAVAVVLAIIASGYFDDGPENTKGQIGFNTQNRDTKNPFGTIDVVQGEGTGFTQGIEEFFTRLTVLDQTIARHLDDAGMARVIDRLSVYDRRASGDDRGGPIEFAFPEGDSTAQGQLRVEGLIEKYGDIMEEFNPKWAEQIRNFKGTEEELLKLIGGFVQLLDITTEIDNAIASLDGNTVEPIKRSIAAMNAAVENAQIAFDAALDTNDPEKIIAAEQQLQQAILTRYNTERDAVAQIQNSLEKLRDDAYQFQLGIENRRINAGGAGNVYNVSVARAEQIRSGYSGLTSSTQRMGAINQYLGAIDNAYQARRQDIERQIAQQQAQMQAMASAQAAIHQADMSARQSELELAQQWVGILGQARQQLDAMRYTATNPLSATGRYAFAKTDSNALFEQFRSLQGQAKLDAASTLLPLLQTRLGLLGDTQQRPSAGYQAGYNEIVAMLTEVEGYAQTQDDKAAQLQLQLNALQAEGNAIGAQSFDAQLTSNSLLDELNATYNQQLDWAEEEWQRQNAEEQRRHQELLDTYTGGEALDVFNTRIASEARDLLRRIADAVEHPNAAPGSGTTGKPTGTPVDASPGGDVVIVNNTVLDGRVIDTTTRRITRDELANSKRLIRDAAKSG